MKNKIKRITIMIGLKILKKSKLMPTLTREVEEQNEPDQNIIYLTL